MIRFQERSVYQAANPAFNEDAGTNRDIGNKEGPGHSSPEGFAASQPIENPRTSGCVSTMLESGAIQQKKGRA